MPTTSNLGLPYPSLSSAPNVPQDIQALAAGIDGLFTATNFTPVLTAATTNPVLGTGGTSLGRYALWGRKMCTYWGQIVWGTTGATAGSGQYFISLPVTATSAVAALQMGSAMMRDNSAPSVIPGTSYLGSTATTLSVVSPSGIVGSGTPWTWAASDYIAWMITYETV